jgi:hypothetical protein
MFILSRRRRYDKRLIKKGNGTGGTMKYATKILTVALFLVGVVCGGALFAQDGQNGDGTEGGYGPGASPGNINEEQRPGINPGNQPLPDAGSLPPGSTSQGVTPSGSTTGGTAGAGMTQSTSTAR